MEPPPSAGRLVDHRVCRLACQLWLALALPSCTTACWRPVLSEPLNCGLSLTLQHSDTDSFPFLRSRLVLVKRAQILRGYVKNVLIVELDHGYAVCGLKNFRVLYWIMDANDMQYMYVNHTYARTDKILN